MVLGTGVHHRLGLSSVEGVDRNRVRWSAALLSCRALLNVILMLVLDGRIDSILPDEGSSHGRFHYVQAGVVASSIERKRYTRDND